MIRSFAASRSYGNEWKYEMPPMSAAPAMKWSQLGQCVEQERRIAGIALDEPVPRVVVVGLRDRPVLRVVVDADDVVPAAQELLHDVTADEPGRSRDEHSSRGHDASTALAGRDWSTRQAAGRTRSDTSADNAEATA